MNILHLILFLVVLVLCDGLRLPSAFPKCQLPTPKAPRENFIQCFKDAAHKSRPTMIKGVPEWGIPSVKEFKIPAISVEHIARALSYNATMTDMIVKGLENYKIQEFSYDFERTMNVTLFFEHLEVQGNFEFVGRVLGETMERSGPIKVSLDQTSTDVQILVNFYKKKSKTFLKLDYDFDVKFGKIEASLNELLRGNKVLNEALNAFLGESSEELVQNFIPDFKKVLISLLLQISDAIIKSTPYEEIFIPSEENV